MESGVPTSFIPQDATVAGGGNRRESGGLSELVLLIAIVSFIASAALAVAAFLYSQYLTGQSTVKHDQLQRAKNAFDPALIQQYTRLDDRMNVADEILKTHIAPTAFFSALNQLTLKTISYAGLTIETTNLKDITLKASGVARSVNSVALEADILSKSGIIVNPIFSDINRGKDGVQFDLNAEINPSNLNYMTLSASNGLPNITPADSGVAPSAAAMFQANQQAAIQTQIASTTINQPLGTTTPPVGPSKVIKK